MTPFEQSVADAIEDATAALDHKVGLGTIRQVERDTLAMLIAAAIGPGGEERSKATAAASLAAEAVNELLNFAREGNQLDNTAYSVSVGENLADAFRLAIDAQGGPEDEQEAQFYAAALRYLGRGVAA
ncbi:hypothetical protein K3M67_03145 [Sphingobium sp. V4]|uniref:hypothetical protein n=1 Tax=Sphingobium sp. V4 TaxID=3038927 RepID=UPI002557D8DC|nr:hypothetical protein [Sphingobium sp. V4]WIW88993.1 hypothetical protein K3M67_03145 [Sphingobium sp. V4]